MEAFEEQLIRSAAAAAAVAAADAAATAVYIVEFVPPTAVFTQKHFFSSLFRGLPFE